MDRARTFTLRRLVRDIERIMGYPRSLIDIDNVSSTRHRSENSGSHYFFLRCLFLFSVFVVVLLLSVFRLFYPPFGFSIRLFYLLFTECICGINSLI